MSASAERPVVLIALHEDVPGGASLAVLRCAPLFAEAGWHPAFWVPGPGPAAALARAVTDLVWERDRPIRYSLRGLREPPGAVSRIGATPSYVRDFGALLRRLRPAVVQANTLYTLPEAAVARRHGIPVVVHAHEILASRPKDRAILAWAAGVARALVAPSEAAAEPLRRAARGVPVAVVRNGVAASSAGAGPGREGEPPVVGTVGVLGPRKGTDLFLAMARRLAERRPGLRFRVLGGDGPGRDAAFAAAARREAAAMRPAIDVEIVQVRDVRREIAGWSAFVLPARQDPFPLAVLEAMAEGLPIVAAAVGGIPEQLGEDGGVLVPPGDPAALAHAVSALLGDPSRRRGLGAAAAARARALFTLDRQAAELCAVYDGCLRGAVARAAA